MADNCCDSDDLLRPAAEASVAAGYEAMWSDDMASGFMICLFIARFFIIPV